MNERRIGPLLPAGHGRLLPCRAARYEITRVAAAQDPASQRSNMTRHRGISIAAGALIVLVGAWARLPRLADASIWLDEAHSLRIAKLNWSTLWLSGYDNTPPLYYSLLKLSLLFGDTELVLRLPSLLAGIATIPVIIWAGSLMSGARAGLAAALFFALSAVQIEYSQEARAYSLLVFNLALAIVGLLLIFQEVRIPGSLTGRGFLRPKVVLGASVYALGTLLALYTHDIAAFFVTCAQLAVVWHWWRYMELDRRFLLLWLGINASVFLLWLPWLWITLFELAGNGTFDWLRQPTLLEAFTELRYVHGVPLVPGAQPWIDLILVVLWLIGVYKLRDRSSQVLLLFLTALVGPLLIWSVGWLEPMFMRKTIMWSGLGSALLFGVAIANISRVPAILISVLVFTCSAFSVWEFHEQNLTEDEDWNGAHAWLQDHMSPLPAGQAVLFCRPSGILPMGYYSRHDVINAPWLRWGGRLGLTSKPVAKWSKDMLRNDTGQSRLAVVVSHCRPSEVDALKLSAHRDGWELQAQKELEGIELYLYGCIGGCPLPGSGDGQ